MPSAMVYKTYKVNKTYVYTTTLCTETLLDIQDDVLKQIISVYSGNNYLENANNEYFTFRPQDMMSTNFQTWPNGMQELRRLSKAIRK